MPKDIKEKLILSVTSLNYNRYPDPFAFRVCDAFGRFAGIKSEYITAGNGSDELISLIFGSFLEKGDSVLILEPDFSMYEFYCSISECKPLLLKKNLSLTFAPDEIIKKANENNVRMIIFSNPCNPTGQGLKSEEVLKIVNGVSCLVVIDEAYMDFWDQSVINSAPEAKNLIVLKTASKAAGLASLRLGFAISNSIITTYLKAAKSPYNVNSFTQAAGEIVFNEKEYLKNTVKLILDSKNSLYKSVKDLESEYKDIKVFETHTNFVLVESIKAEHIHFELKKSGISVRLLGGKYLRITAGSSEENLKLINALKLVLSETDKKEVIK